MKKFYLLLTAALISVFAANAFEAKTLTKSDKQVNVTENIKINNTVKANLNADCANLGKASTRLSRAEGDDAELTWTKADGLLRFTDDCMTTFFNFPNLTSECEYEECDQIPGYYRVWEPYSEIYEQIEGVDSYQELDEHLLYIHAEDPNRVWIEEFATGFIILSKYGEMYIHSLAGYWLDNGKTMDEVEEAGLFGTLLNGVISFPTRSLLVAMTLYNDGAYYYANQTGAFKVLFPGAIDYYINLYSVSCTADNSGVFYIEYNEELKNIKWDVIPGNYGASNEDFAYIAENGYDFEGESDYAYAVSLGDQGRYTLFAVGLDEDGNVVCGDVAYFFGLDNTDNWTSLGKTKYGEDFIASTYSNYFEVTDLDVEIQVNNDTPGFYRLVNPYDGYADIQEANNHEADHNHYIYIHAENPDQVWIGESPIGVNFGDGDMIVNSLASLYLNDYGLTADEIIEELGNVFGQLKDSKVTMPIQSLLISELDYSNGSWSYANYNEGFYVNIPDPAGIENVATDDNAPAVYYNLQGIKVNNPNNGVYIVRKGNVAKTIIR